MVSVTDVAVTIGALFGAAGADVGGVKTTLVFVWPLRLPQVGEHFAPPAVSDQVTPAFVESFATVAFSVTAAAPAAIVEILLVIETEMGCVFAVIVKAAESDFVVSAADVAVIVGALLGAAGAVAGGV